MKLLTTIICMISALEIASGQPMDSIGFSKARLQAGKYELHRFGISKIKIKNKGPSAATDDGISTDEKIIEGALTLFLGFSTSSSSESKWLLNNHVKFGGIDKEIGFPVLVDGYYKKSRERVRDDDGSRSVETVETYDLYWDQGAEGIIREDGNTLGDFSLRTRIMANDSLSYWKQFIRPNPQWLDEKLDSYGNYYELPDFLIKILFEGKQYIIVYNGECFQFALIQHQEMIGLWQDTPTFGFTSKKKRIHPYLLLPRAITDPDAQRTISLLSLGLSLARSIED